MVVASEMGRETRRNVSRRHTLSFEKHRQSRHQIECPPVSHSLSLCLFVVLTKRKQNHSGGRVRHWEIAAQQRPTPHQRAGGKEGPTGAVAAPC
jgi:hypothetical protein